MRRCCRRGHGLRGRRRGWARLGRGLGLRALLLGRIRLRWDGGLEGGSCCVVGERNLLVVTAAIVIAAAAVSVV